jgi:hypothetical protein
MTRTATLLALVLFTQAPALAQQRQKAIVLL